jgi:hypothetical protein
MTQPTPSPLDLAHLRRDAEDLTATAERARTPEAKAAAREAFDVLGDAAVAQIRIGVQPLGADVLADLQFYSETFHWSTWDQQAADLYARCQDSHPALARALRSEQVVERAARLASPAPTPEAIEEVGRRYVRAIAAAMQRDPASAPAAEILTTMLPALEARLAALDAA